MKNLIKEAAIIALAILGFGCLFHSAVDNFIDKDRTVTVKGLAEMEVKADKVLEVEEVLDIFLTREVVTIQPHGTSCEGVCFVLRRDTREGDEVNILPFAATL